MDKVRQIEVLGNRRRQRDADHYYLNRQQGGTPKRIRPATKKRTK